MWRGARAVRALLGGRAGGVAAGPGSAVGTRRLRAGKPVAAPLLPPKGAPVAQRRACSLGTSRLRGAEEAAPAEPGQQQEAVGPQPRTCPETGEDPSDYASSTFSIDHMVSLLRQENAKDICVIQLPPELRYCSYFIVVSGSSTRHLHAMAHYLVKMHKHLKTDAEPHVLIEGKETDNWLCIDFGNIVVHFMMPETREIYELEKLWTLRSYDDQLVQMVPESLPDDFIFGLPCEQE